MIGPESRPTTTAPATSSTPPASCTASMRRRRPRRSGPSTGTRTCCWSCGPPTSMMNSPNCCRWSLADGVSSRSSTGTASAGLGTAGGRRARPPARRPGGELPARPAHDGGPSPGPIVRSDRSGPCPGRRRPRLQRAGGHLHPVVLRLYPGCEDRRDRVRQCLFVPTRRDPRRARHRPAARSNRSRTRSSTAGRSTPLEAEAVSPPPVFDGISTAASRRA